MNGPMRIAHVIDSLEVGGAEAVVTTLCRLQSKAGHQVEVHCLMTGGAFALSLEAEGIPVYVHGPAGTLSLVSRLYRAFRRSRPQVVHCHNKTATVHGAAVARMTGAKVVVSTRHGMAALPYRLRQDLKFWVAAALFCDRVVAVCETARHNMMAGAKAVRHKVVTIRNGAYPPPTGADAAGPKRGFTLITVGRLAPAKSYATLLRSVARARARVPDLVLSIVGDGPEAAALKHLSVELGISGAVQFHGERREVGDWLRRADVFILSSISEGLPISLLEAMAAGLPAIVTCVGGMPEVIDLSGAGKVVPPRDVERLAEAIVEFADRRKDLVEMGRRAWRCYEEHFTPDRMANDYLSLYRMCLRPQETRI